MASHCLYCNVFNLVIFTTFDFVSHKSIRLLLEETVNSLADDIQFSYGTETDFNQSKKKGTILINVAPLSSVPSYAVNGNFNYNKQWNVEMVFYKPDNSREITYTQILDELDDYVDRFVNNLNTFQMKSDQITLSSMNQQPFIKATADILTGYLLTFQILAMDSFDYCRDC
jgi:hypothetical protein